MLGIWPIDEIIDWFSDAFGTYIVEPISNFISYIVGIVLYYVQIGLFYIMDVVQLVFRKAAGLDVYYNNGVAVEGDLTIQFIQSSTVQAVFISILVAAIFLLFITTFIAVLKTEFDEKDNSKGPIFKNALKAIAYFVIVPVVCFMGVWVSNIVLRMLDSATSRGAESFSTQVFTAAAYNANRARADAEFAKEVWQNCQWIPGMNTFTITTDSATPAQQEMVADLVDTAFRSMLQPTTDDHSASVTIIRIWSTTVTFSSFDVKNYDLIFYFYDPLDYNYIIGYIASFSVVMILLKLLIGVILRIFELSVLFVLSPLAVSLMPLDGGERYKAWRGAFVKRVFSAYGPIIGLNLVFMVLTLLQTVQLFPDGGINDLFNALVQLIFIFTGLVSINSIVEMVTDMVGQGNALKEGESAAKDVKALGGKTIGTVASVAAKPATWSYNRIANARNRRELRNRAGQGLTFDKETGQVTNEADENSAELEDVGGFWKRGVGKVTSFGGHRRGKTGSLADLYTTRKQQLKGAKEYFDNGGEYLGEDGETHTLNKWGLSEHRVTKDLADNFELHKRIGENNKLFGKNPISGFIKKNYIDPKEDSENLKKVKRELKVKDEATEQLMEEKKGDDSSEKKAKAKELTERLKGKSSSGDGSTTTPPGGESPSAPPPSGEADETINLDESPQAQGQDNQNNGAGGPGDMGSQANPMHITGEVSISGGTIKTSQDENDDSTYNAAKINTNKTDMESKKTENNGKQRVKIEDKVKIDDSAVVRELRAVKEATSGTYRGISDKLKNIESATRDINKKLDKKTDGVNRKK